MTIKNKSNQNTENFGTKKFKFEKKHIFNLQSSKSKPYDLNNILKSTNSNNQNNKWGDLYKRFFIDVTKYSHSPAIFFAGVLGCYIIFIS